MAERIFCMVIFVLGIMGFGYMTGDITNLVGQLVRKEEQHRAMVNEIQEYMRYRNIPAGMQMELHGYFSYYFEQTPIFTSSEQEILETLTPALFEKVCKHLKQDVLQNNTVFCGHGNSFMIDVLSILKPVLKYPDEVVTKQGENAKEMFFLRTGKLKVMSDKDDTKYLYMMRSPNALGEGGLFGGKRKSTTIAGDLCDLFSLSGHDLRKVLMKLPDNGASVMQQVALERELKSLTRREKSMKNMMIQQSGKVDNMRVAGTYYTPEGQDMKSMQAGYRLGLFYMKHRKRDTERKIQHLLEQEDSLPTVSTSSAPTHKISHAYHGSTQHHGDGRHHAPHHGTQAISLSRMNSQTEFPANAELGRLENVAASLKADVLILSGALDDKLESTVTRQEVASIVQSVVDTEVAPLRDSITQMQGQLQQILGLLGQPPPNSSSRSSKRISGRWTQVLKAQSQSQPGSPSPQSPRGFSQ